MLRDGQAANSQQFRNLCVRAQAQQLFFFACPMVLLGIENTDAFDVATPAHAA
jgi:hypothetical protein